jgi:hypothetical protein
MMYTTILLAAALQNWDRYSAHALAAREVAATLAKGASHLPDLREAEGETAARPGRLDPGLHTRAAYYMQIDHPYFVLRCRRARVRGVAQPRPATHATRRGGRTPVQAGPPRQALTRRDPGPATRGLAGGTHQGPHSVGA